MVAQLVGDQWVGGSNPLSPTILEACLKRQVFFRLSKKRMRTSRGGLSRAQRDNVASATARRARLAEPGNPLSPTILETCLKRQVFFRLNTKRMRISTGDWGRVQRVSVAVSSSLRREYGQIGKALMPSMAARPARLRTSSLRCARKRANALRCSKTLPAFLSLARDAFLL